MHNKTVSFITIILITFLPLSHAENARTRLHQYEAEELQLSDIKAEIKFGRQVAARLLAAEKLYNNNKLTHYINLIGTYLVVNSSRSDLQF